MANTLKDGLFHALETESLPQSISHQISEAVLDGQLPPGTRLTEMQLARQMGVSRGPVREALRMLEQQGLVTSSPYKGWRVTELDPTDIEEIYTLRTVLECFALRRAARHMNPDDLNVLQGVVDEMAAAANAHDSWQASLKDLEFHTLIWELSGHRLLLETLSAIRNKIQMLLAYDMRLHEDLQPVIGDHQEIIDRLKNEDAKGAVESLQTNLLKAQRVVLEKLRTAEVDRDDVELDES